MPHGPLKRHFFVGFYAEPEDREFYTGHRDTDPMNRNCSIMRAARSENVVICHYFPSMVQEAISAARTELARLKSVPVRSVA
jgi:hypothetical protein